ncbi:MAG: Ig-like domain-containing protein, partial [Pseudomonadota bacterium]
MITSSATDPVSGAFPVTVTFSEAVTGFAIGDLAVGNGTASNFVATSSSVYTATIAPSADGAVTVNIAAGAAQDSAGNASEAASQFSLQNDATAPTVAITSSATDPVSGAFPITVTFSEAVTGFALGDLTIGNGAASDFAATSATTYTATITPTADGAVTVDVAAGAAQDTAGNNSEAASQFSLESDTTAPTLSILVDTLEVSGPFTATFEFSEPVGDATVDRFTVTNGAISEFTGSDQTYRAIITPDTFGVVEITAQEGAGTDAAGNPSTATSLSVTASADLEPVTVMVATGQDPSSVSGSFTLSNPGSASINFTASTDQVWMDVTPETGVLTGLSGTDFSFAVNDRILELPAGTYVANIIVSVDNGSSQSLSHSSNTSGPVAAQTSQLAVVPVTVELAEQFGDFTLIVRTPTGLTNGASFVLSSDIPQIDGQSVPVNAGELRFTVTDLLNGTYQIEQTIADGYLITAMSCGGDADGGNVIDPDTGRITVDLDAGESQTCIIENDNDDAAIRLATMKAIRGFMGRRGDRVLSSAPDLSNRFDQRDSVSPGRFSANGNDRTTSMVFGASLSGARNKSRKNAAKPGTNFDTGPASGWDAWVSAEYARLDDDRGTDAIDSKFFVSQLGADVAVRPNLLIGGLVQYDWMS